MYRKGLMWVQIWDGTKKKVQSAIPVTLLS